MDHIRKPQHFVMQNKFKFYCKKKCKWYTSSTLTVNGFSFMNKALIFSDFLKQVLVRKVVELGKFVLFFLFKPKITTPWLKRRNETDFVTIEHYRIGCVWSFKTHCYSKVV